ncbi:methyltransferase domain-containing protein [Dyella sedimenti]|uniref:methyltransferase domain-containing protein n=1 Tax=Dyella sedimenti TaxID=2919947 RepID=UPI001FAB03E0|nr:methyltransferase domain-containing protein [Dyella sedimenti]
MNTYDNPFHRDNVYGHTLSLLLEHSGAHNGVHLDIGCSYGRIAEHIRDQLGREYIGFDLDEQALGSLVERGFRTERIDLSDIDAAERIIRTTIDGRHVASLSIIDTLEHVLNPDAVVSMLRRIAIEHSAPLVMSVPNVAHRDVGAKLAFGKWDYTDTGLLDITHLRFFTETSVRELMRGAGWHLVSTKYVFAAKSDQHFPNLHPALAEATPLHDLLIGLRNQVDDCAKVNQFVGLYLPGPAIQGEAPNSRESESKPPFLSVITRTQGTRLDTLRDVLLCLSAQSSQDFEVCIIGHKLSPEAKLAVERVIDDTHAEFKARIRLISVDDGNRTRPLNVGFEAARGDYVAILDDDDIVLGHWVEKFEAVAAANPGRVLRLGNVAQLWQPVHTTHGSKTVRSVGSPEACFPFEFDFFQHLVENSTPPVSLAFPRACFADLRIRFDESLTTTEDWDFLMRTAEVCGVASDKEITSIYRKWDNAASSYTVHSQDEWRNNHFAIWRKLDAKPLLLDSGSATRLRYLVDDWNRNHRGRVGHAPDPELDSTRYENALREQIHIMLRSRTWLIGAPLRLAAWLRGRRFSYPMLWAMQAPQLENYIAQIRTSRSWRFGQWVKKQTGR